MPPPFFCAVAESWACEELNLGPHAYQASSREREIDSQVPTRLPFTNILLSTSPIYEHLAHFGEHFAHLNGHHNGHQEVSPRGLPEGSEPPLSLAQRVAWS